VATYYQTAAYCGLSDVQPKSYFRNRYQKFNR